MINYDNGRRQPAAVASAAAPRCGSHTAVGPASPEVHVEVGLVGLELVEALVAVYHTGITPQHH